MVVWLEWLSSDVTIPVWWSIIIHVCFIATVLRIFHNLLTYIDEKIIGM